MSVKLFQSKAIHCRKCGAYLGKTTQNQRKNLTLFRMSDNHKCVKWVE